jgi:hypothetical protein
MACAGKTSLLCRADLEKYAQDLSGPGSSVGKATGYGLEDVIFRTRPDQPWGPPALLYNGYQVFPGGKAAGAWCWPSSAEVTKGYSYTSIHPLGQFIPVARLLYLLRSRILESKVAVYDGRIISYVGRKLTYCAVGPSASYKVAELSLCVWRR